MPAKFPGGASLAQNSCLQCSCECWIITICNSSPPGCYRSAPLFIHSYLPGGNPMFRKAGPCAIVLMFLLTLLPGSAAMAQTPPPPPQPDVKPFLFLPLLTNPAGEVSGDVAVFDAAAGSSTRQIPAGGTTVIRQAPAGADGLQQPELRPGAAEDEGAGSFNRPRPGFKNGKFPKKPLDAPTVASSGIAGSNPELAVSVDGLTLRQQRLANGGNQYYRRAAGPGPVCRQRLCRGNREQRAARLLHRQTRCTADGRAGSQHLLRLSGCHRPHDRRRSAPM